jgi:hypothetical protein
VDEKIREEHAASSTYSTTTISRPRVFDSNLLTKELVLEVNLSEEQVDDALHDNDVKTSATALQNAKPVLTEQDIPAIPTLADYRKFALPCLGLLISGPLLSLVDTAFVGMASTSSSQLAALGPATTLVDCLSWLLSFMSVATLNLYSSARAKGSQEEAEGVVRTGARVGLTCGVGVMATLMIFCKPILAGYMGTFYVHLFPLLFASLFL